MSNNLKAVLVLKNGSIFYGNGFGVVAQKTGELVFNTSMVGYQEALTDPSYAGQILLMTYPLVGNYGTNETDFESDKVHLEGFVLREDDEVTYHRKTTKTLDTFLKENNTPGISGIDTRAIVRQVRSEGVMPAIIKTYQSNETVDVKKLIEELNFNYSAVNFVEKVSIKEPKVYGKESDRTVVLIDYGAKLNIIRELVKRNLKVIVVPHNTSFEKICAYTPLGVFLSNGPGDPKMLTNEHAVIRKLIENNYPIMGICLGHQLIGHALGGTTYKMKFGHRGSNQPVLDKIRNKVVMTTQNHGYAVDNTKIPDDLELTHVNINDGTNEGMRHKSKKVFSVQYHPEACPGPNDSKYLFDDFVKNLL
ncbi:MAG: glutamine-hydrolyzing carbamoyl-phosphate synthase small subunit [Candidatus Micrarchaeota archaeon]